jgi:hypothetical protein
MTCCVGGAPRGTRTPNRQIRSHRPPVPSRPPYPCVSPSSQLNGHADGPGRASVPTRHASRGRNLVAVSGCRCQTGCLATCLVKGLWDAFGDPWSTRFGIWCSDRLRASELGETAMLSRGFPCSPRSRDSEVCAVSRSCSGWPSRPLRPGTWTTWAGWTLGARQQASRRTGFPPPPASRPKLHRAACARHPRRARRALLAILRPVPGGPCG